MRSNEIIDIVENIRVKLNSPLLKNPFLICEAMNIPVRYNNLNPKIYPSYTSNISNTPIISLNTNYTRFSQLVLCSHELGHAILHQDNFYNGFDGKCSEQEYEANLFAVALLFPKEQRSMFSVAIEKMSNTELKSILDCNIKLRR